MNWFSKKFVRPVTATLLLLISLGGCAVNAVTGERNFQIYGSKWEQEVGGQMYEPMKQSQGGEFILDPELTAYVQEIGERLAQQARRKDELAFEFGIINSSVPNAWALPGGKIVVNRGLLTQLNSEAELAAVIGHEIVHADAAHGAQMQSKGMLAQVGAIASMVVLGSTVENEQLREIAMLVPTLGLQLTMQKYGRDAERESDEFGMTYMSESGYDPQGAVQLQETFVRLSEGRPDDWFSGLFASHPPSRERLENNRKTASALPPGGDFDVQKYLQKTARVRALEPAYSAYDKAAKAMTDDDLKLAQKNLSRALQLEPREALFHTLQGDIYRQEKKSRNALRSYERAIAANNNLFYGHLRKGQLEFEKSNWASARTSLETSQSLLPTAEAFYLLGAMDLSAGNKQAAISNFKSAAQSKSESGNKARNELVALDIGDNPGAYVQTAAVLDSSSNAWMLLANTTDLAIGQIVVNVTWLDQAGRTRQEQRSFKGPLAAGQQERVKLNLQFPGPQELNQRLRLQVTAAQLSH